MPRAAVVGSPVGHSLSPVLHEAAYAVCGLSDWSYVRREVTAADLAEVVASLDASWRGLSLTMPLKEVAFDVAETVTDIARQAGAINTLVRRDDGGWDATNTDVQGILEAVRQVDHGGEATVLGSGATARSAILAMAGLRVERVVLAARNAEAVGALAELAATLGMKATSVSLGRWIDRPSRLVISTLPPSAGPAAAGVIDESRAGSLAGLTLLDVVYADWPTPLARAVTAAHGEVVSGLDMLVHQAAAQFELFTGVGAPVDAMFAAGRAALGSETRS
ncbi:MAG TPA: shikimate dehydrogenase [Phycicoccus sp.]|mgnify:CR=1 FL=1|jgi:shikimate dehydrogenase|nr:shikimate dehydrogenase [Phycicoccus sp.]